MTDVLTKAQRSYNMSRIRRHNTLPELRLKKHFEKKGFLYQPQIYGKPDFVNFRKKIAIFIDGCFWHKCPKHFVQPKTHRTFWANKINSNVIRDIEITKNYMSSGWKVTRIWEHKIQTRRFINTKILE